MPRPAPQAFNPNLPAQNWEENWGRANDYIAPEAEPNHPLLSGNVRWVRPEQLQQPEQ